MAKKNKVKETFLDELRKIPIVLVACEKSGVSRNSVYRWKREDKAFSKEMDEALAEGEELVNDMSESQLLTLIKEKNFSAVRYWLSHRNPKFRDKVEVTTRLGVGDDELTSEQEKIVKRALELATLPTHNTNQHDNNNGK